jgi:hypothetical protein
MLIEILKQMYITRVMDINLQNIVMVNLCNQYLDHLHLSNVINAIVNAAEKEGGIHKISLCGSKKRFRDSIQDNFLWYNNIDTQSTNVVRMED